MKGLPTINDLVLVRVGEPETVLRARVEETAPGVISISYPSDGDTEHPLPVSTRVTLEWLVDRGLGTATGTVFALADVGVPALSVKLDAAPVVVQRREHARADIALEVDIWLPDGPVPGVTLDVSGGGLRAVVPVSFEPDALARLSINMQGGRPIEALARVVAQREDGVVAFEFDEIVAADRERLIQAVFASYRVTASVRRAN